MRRFYLLLTVLGAAVPLSAFVPWVATHGLDAHLFVSELFSNQVSTFFALDVLMSAVVVISMARRDRGILRLWWLPIVMTAAVGVSAGLPLLLYLRETARPLRD